MEEFNQFTQTVYFNDTSANGDIIELLFFPDREEIKRHSKSNEVVFLLNGNCEIECDIYLKFKLNKDEAVFFPANCNYSLIHKEKIVVLSIKLNLFQRLAGCASIEELSREISSYQINSQPEILKIDFIIQNYLKTICSYIKDNIATPLLFDIKSKELLFILNYYYSRKKLANFFGPILNNEVNFASFVLSNWQSVKSVKELAGISGYCNTTFSRKFKNVFGCTPYKWLNDRKAAQIYYELSNSSKPFKKIAEEYGFNSQQHLNDYCVRYFKKAPGGIRFLKV